MLAPDLSYLYTGQAFAVRPARGHDVWLEVIASTSKTITVRVIETGYTRTLRFRKDGTYRLSDTTHYLLFTDVDPRVKHLV